MSRVVPKYRKRADGYSFIEHRSIPTKSRRMVLGKYGSPESIQRYQNFLARLQGQQTSLVALPGRWPTVDELIDAYLDFAEGFYSRETADGRELSTEFDGMLHALNALEPYGEMSADLFGPKTLAAIRTQLARKGRARSGANHVVSRIKKFWRWCCENELCPPDLYHKLICVRGLVRGQDGCAEPEPVGPASAASIKGVLPYVSPTVAAMIQIQHRCGMRPQEVCVMKRADIDMSQDVWLYRPERNKCGWRNMSLIKAIPPSIQDTLRPYLLNLPYLFSPGRKRDRYTTETYRRAISYGFAKAKKAGVELEQFTPNRLRHSILTEVSEHLGREAAQLWAWHEKADTTGLYVKKRIAELMNVARQVDARLNASA